MNEINLNTILKVKDSNGNWIQIPAIKGTSAYTLPAEPTSRVVGTNTQYGYLLKIYDEKKAILDPNYEYDLFEIWNGLDGEGLVNTVDNIPITSGSLNVQLDAVSFGRIQTELRSSAAAQEIARENINAFKNIANPSDGAIVKYSAAASEWQASNLDVIEISGAVPETREINGYALSSDITLVPSDIGAVHSALKINGVSISNSTMSNASITLTPTNINAVHSALKINGVSISSATTPSASITLTPANIGAVPLSRTINGQSLQNNITTRIIETNKTVSSASWSAVDSSESDYYADFNYRGVIAVNGVTAAMVPQVVFGVEESTSGNFASIASTVTNAIYIYSNSVPETDITIPTIICFV